jgi:CRP/FNR family transcriptional regulator, cyclic AMP receptor protein
MKALKEILNHHPVFKDLDAVHRDILCGLARKSEFTAGTFIFKTGEKADCFYLIQSGKVAVQVYSPTKGALNILTLNSNDILGWSWIYPPYLWHFESKALTDVCAYQFDAIAFRELCSRDSDFGYKFLNCFNQILVQRIVATRLQLLDIFGTNAQSPTLYG